MLSHYNSLLDKKAQLKFKNVACKVKLLVGAQDITALSHYNKIFWTKKVQLKFPVLRTQ